MSKDTSIDIAELIERQPIGRFAIGLIVACWLVTFFDGYDMTVIAFTAKPLTHAFALSKPMLANVFASGVFGTVVGGLSFGWLGDLIGRRTAIVISTSAFGVLTLAVALAQSYPQLLALRFIDGVALGGAIPLVWALAVECVPKRFRARVVTLIMLGYGFGASLSGPLARGLIPHYGWQGVFLFGGAASITATVLLFIFLPESLRFLVTSGASAARIERVIRRLAPAATIPPGAAFHLSDETAARQKVPFAKLFQGELMAITPLLWLTYVASSVAAYFMSTWGPLVLEELGFSADHAAWLAAANSICGALGGLAIMRFTDRWGPLSIAILPAVAAPLLLIAGLVPMGLSVFLVLSLVLSLFLGGGQYAIQSIVSAFYPSALRASGSGWAGSVAKIGGIAAPLLGGVIQSTSLPVKTTYALLAACPAVYLICVVSIGLIDRRMRREAAAAPAPAAQRAVAAE